MYGFQGARLELRLVDCRNTLFAFLPDPLDWCPGREFVFSSLQPRGRAPLHCTSPELRRRALQCACRWRTGLEDLLAKAPILRSPKLALGFRGFEVHLDPRLRSAVGRCICTLRRPAESRIRAWRLFKRAAGRLPREDLLGDRVQSAELSVESERFFVTLLGARPKGVQGKVRCREWSPLHSWQCW